MLRKLLRQHPNSERGWLLMSMAVLDAPRQRECLRHVLRINPFNTEAQARLAGLSTDQGEVTAQADPVIADEPGNALQPVEELANDMAMNEPAPVEEYNTAGSALPTTAEAGAPEPQSLDAESEVSAPLGGEREGGTVVAPPTRPSVTSILVPPAPVTSSSSTVIAFEPDRRAPSTEPPASVAASELALDAAAMEIESKSVVETPAAMKVEPKPVAETPVEYTPEPLASVAESIEPAVTDTRSNRRASRSRKSRAGRSASERRSRPPEAAPPADEPPAKPPTAPLTPAAPSLEPVVNWQRLYEQPAVPSAPAPVAVDQSPIQPLRSAPPQRELPPAPQRDYYEEEPWPRFMLPAALLIWAAIVIVIFFVIARLLMG